MTPFCELDPSAFEMVLRNTPLVAVDLLVKNKNGAYLLGFRKNKPAQNFWFVPGGRIYKGETFRMTIPRISKSEMGFPLQLDQLELRGVSQHLYTDNVFNDASYGTHYIVLAFHTRSAISCLSTGPTAQSSEMRFFEINELLESDQVHPYSKAYFKSSIVNGNCCHLFTS